MKYILTLFILSVTLTTSIAQIQLDPLCINIDQINPEGYDIFSGLPGFVAGNIQLNGTECYYVQEDRLFLSSDPSCCEVHPITFSLGEDGENYTIDVEIKCPEPKPDCLNIDLSEISSDTSTGFKQIISACDQTPINYFIPEAPGQTITWTAPAGTITQGPDHVASIVWSSPGSHTITVTVGTETTEYCVDVLDSPDADFIINGGCGCLNTSVDFSSTGIGGNEFFWDFGDGNFATGENASNIYDTPGIYDVTLVVVQDNYDMQGRPLCCCSDTISMPLTIEPLEGPEIFWISTLCEGDSTKYWTTAEGCTYTWTAEDADGNSVLPLGTDITNDTLCVVWGDGPYGVVSVAVDGCSDGPYCAKPTTVIVPIIESVSTIIGQDTVCSQSSEFYDLPKWPTVTYEWSIDPPSAGFIVSGQGTNSVNINWGVGPTTATINATYGSDFLGGIFGHTPEDCEGSASFTVDILPRMELIQPTQSKYCIDDLITFEAGDAGFTNIDPINGWTWEIQPPVGSTILSTGNVAPYTTSFSLPGFYTVLGYPDYPNPYCNDTLSTIIEIVEVPLPDSITGNKIVCPNSTEIYFGHTSTPGTQLEWAVTGGMITSPIIGNPVTVDWDASGPYIISVRQVQIASPECASEYIDCPIEPKVVPPPSDIIGMDACTNDIATYSISPVPTDPDVTYSWSISPPSMGSVIAGETATSCDIQWNNTAGSASVIIEQTLCGITTSYSEIFTISEASPVTLSQNKAYCVGDLTVTLTASTAGATYIWDKPSSAPAPGPQTIPVTEAGNYVVTVTESSGCTAVANHIINEVDGPNTNLTSPFLLNLCTSDMGEIVTLHALSGPWIITEWWKSTNAGPYMLQTLPVDPLVYQHTNTGSVGTCTYYYVAENTLSCESQSNTITVTQSICSGGGTGDVCTPENHNAELTYTSSTNCNEITFNPTISPNVTITGWNFNDPINISPTGPGPMFTYSTAGYYVAIMYYSVPNTSGPGSCDLTETTSVCVPLVADFSITNNNCGNYVFTNTSSFIDGMAPDNFEWIFGDGNTTSGPSPIGTNSYTTYGLIDVTLIITNPDGCQSEITQQINVQPPPVADIVIMPADTCVNKPFAFSNLDDTGIVSWDWAFGDGDTNGGDAPSHAYLVDGSYMVTLTVTDENGCTASDIESLVVHPAPVTGPITYSDDLLICPGESITLDAPAGDTYIWNTLETTASITTTLPGVYGVTVTDANGCSFVPDSVEVILLPEIDATISGSNVICDDGCTTLFAVSGSGYTYSWEDQGGNIIPPNAPPSSITICQAQGILEVNLTITDDNGCTAMNTLPIEYFNSPNVNIVPSDPSLCAGTPNTLTAITSYPNPVEYSWNTGSSMDNITVSIEGSYYVTITDPATGCSNVDFIVINPLPDLCIVPTGCYKACDPDTLCAPDDLVSYEWYYNGVLDPAYSGMQCITVTESGRYNFEGTNTYGCSDVSDTLYLEMMPCCRPGDTEIFATPIPALGPCCYSFTYSVNQDIFYGLDLYSADAGLDMDLTSIDPSLSITSSIPALNSFASSTSGDPLPLGPISNFITICLDDPTANPSEIIADWIGEDGEVLCSDTLLLDCLVEPDCVYVLSDSIYCGPNDNLLIDMTICNPLDADYSIGYIDLVEIAPLGATFIPSAIDLTSDPLAPGECRDFTFDLAGSGIANDTLKYKIVGHSENPEENPGALCCSVDYLNCAFIPGCTPCDMVFISSVDSSDIGDCCYDITINNYFDENVLDGVDICVLSPGASFDVVNPIGSPWDITTLTSMNASLDYNDGSTTTIPFGDVALPTICIAESDTPLVEIEIKWMKGGTVSCRDTITILCEGDCGYMSDISVICGDNGTWIISGTITNTSDHIVSSAFIDLGNDILNGSDTELSFGSLAPGETSDPFVIIVDIPSVNLTELCIITTLHSEGHTDEHEECCEFKTIVNLPDCQQTEDCLCDSSFEDLAEQGINCTVTSVFTYEFSPIAQLMDCDRVVWNWLDEQTANTTLGNQSIQHTFPGPGEYTVCMEIIRTQPDGKQCKSKFCKDVTIFHDGLINTYPNPANNFLQVTLKDTDFEGEAQIELIDANNRVMSSQPALLSSRSESSIDVKGMKSGVYILRIVIDNNVFTKRVLVVH